MATDVAKAKAAQPQTPPSPPKRGLVYFGRFYFVYVVLALALCGAIVGAVLAVRSGSGIGGSGQAWSTWQPSGGGLGQAEQIASHVGAEYRLGNGGQLAAVIAKPPVVSINNHSIGVGYVAIHGGKDKPDVVSSTSSSSTVLFTICGLGPSCSIPTGTPSIARGRLVRREILELALYTFHYNSAIHNIIAFMPPASTTQQPVMIFLQRADLASRLGQPLDTTLNAHTPTVSTMTSADKAQVDELTGRRGYSWSLQQAQDGNAIFVLNRIKA